MPVYDPKPRMIEVRSNHMNTLLFVFNPSKMEIKLKRNGVIHGVKLHDLMEFANKSQRVVFHAEVIIEDKDETE